MQWLKINLTNAALINMALEISFANPELIFYLFISYAWSQKSLDHISKLISIPKETFLPTADKTWLCYIDILNSIYC